MKGSDPNIPISWPIFECHDPWTEFDWNHGRWLTTTVGNALEFALLTLTELEFNLPGAQVSHEDPPAGFQPKPHGAEPQRHDEKRNVLDMVPDLAIVKCLLQSGATVTPTAIDMAGAIRDGSILPSDMVATRDFLDSLRSVVGPSFVEPAEVEDDEPRPHLWFTQTVEEPLSEHALLSSSAQLMEAVDMGNVVEVQATLEAGADVNTCRILQLECSLEGKGRGVDQRQGESALAASILSGRVDLVEVLLEAGSDPMLPVYYCTAELRSPWEQWDFRNARWAPVRFSSSLALALQWGLDWVIPPASAYVHMRDPQQRRTVQREIPVLVPKVDIVRALLEHGAVVTPNDIVAANQLRDNAILPEEIPPNGQFLELLRQAWKGDEVFPEPPNPESLHEKYIHN
ncbi:hypothetical protein HDU93_008446 [Gonapodya sp. JEL0774]|nr:hypothetical protein HDU93_008446 [Gonapodya sp. JEL0774]